jgi:hypothetical protein
MAGHGEHGELTFTRDQKSIMILRLPRTPSLNLDGLLTIEVSGRICGNPGKACFHSDVLKHHSQAGRID